jgi:HEAT repeat protein
MLTPDQRYLVNMTLDDEELWDDPVELVSSSIVESIRNDWAEFAMNVERLGVVDAQEWRRLAERVLPEMLDEANIKGILELEFNENEMTEELVQYCRERYIEAYQKHVVDDVPPPEVVT